MPPNAPPPWLPFLIMVVAVSAFVGLIIILGGLLRAARGESFWPREASDLRPAGDGVRSAALRTRFKRSHGVQQRSPRPNAENRLVQGVQAFTDRSNVQPTAPPIAGDLPATLDELQRLAHTIALYAKRPNKELAIFDAWGETKGEGEGYKRASSLFDAAMSDAARAAAKAKAPAPAERPIPMEA